MQKFRVLVLFLCCLVCVSGQAYEDFFGETHDGEVIACELGCDGRLPYEDYSLEDALFQIPVSEITGGHFEEYLAEIDRVTGDGEFFIEVVIEEHYKIDGSLAVLLTDVKERCLNYEDLQSGVEEYGFRVMFTCTKKESTYGMSSEGEVKRVTRTITLSVEKRS